ncbi:hypothetical protein IWX81_002514 [Salinibacterium sp. CAN_S4]|uniref:hypothetical protein n=1 Tax=Salinibacterium sp. CAN_S4 TaxID=2787727 RepID=UPI0018EFB66F
MPSRRSPGDPARVAAAPQPTAHRFTQKDTLMRTTMTTAPGRHDHPPQPQHTNSHPALRVAVIDRLALHLGLALIRWGRRPRFGPTFERRANRVERELALESRERAWERTARLTLPLR